jgi:Ca-activated chloride channel family protein
MAAAPSPERVRQLVFITDGSVGNEDELFTFIRQHLGQQRLFTVGIGSAPNRHFMRGAARFGRGTFTEVGSLEEVETKMDGLWAKLDAPLMKDLSLGWQGGAAPDVWPARLPDLYRGEPLVILAKLQPGHRGVKLEGLRSGEPFAADLRLDGTGTERGIHRLWARRKIEDLMDMSSGGMTESEIRSRVVPLALEHHIVSKYTSLVAIDTVRTANGPARQVAVGLALPAGNDMFGNMPQTATPGPFCLLLGALSFALAGVLQRRGGAS